LSFELSNMSPQVGSAVYEMSCVCVRIEYDMGCVCDMNFVYSYMCTIVYEMGCVYDMMFVYVTRVYKI